MQSLELEALAQGLGNLGSLSRGKGHKIQTIIFTYFNKRRQQMTECLICLQSIMNE